MSAMYLQEARTERTIQAWHRYVHGRTVLPSLGTVHQLTLATHKNQHSKHASVFVNLLEPEFYI